MRTALLVVAMMSCTVVANLLLKMGATAGREGGAPWWAVNWRIAAGLACFGAAGLIYAVVLRFLPLNVAQSFTAAQFIATILASALVLAEPVTGMRWVGIALIASGILVVGWTHS
jgi:drug/metabolite transporter (DMT)-like permease